jgi:hypothetical protein
MGRVPGRDRYRAGYEDLVVQPLNMPRGKDGPKDQDENEEDSIMYWTKYSLKCI